MVKSQAQRVELNCYSCMNRMDSVVGIEEMFQFVKEQGMKAFAITDYNSIQAFPTIQEIQEKSYKDIKPIYGMHCLVVEDEFSELVDSKLKIGGLSAFRVSVLARNLQGCRNLNKIMTYMLRTGTKTCNSIPWSVLNKYRDGLLFGSGSYSGELQNSIVKGIDGDVLYRIAERYDYLEVQPEESAEWLIENETAVGINSTEDIRSAIEKVTKIGEELQIPVVAVSDARYLRPENKLSRDVMLTAGGRTDLDVGLYVRTTAEMLDCFDFLGKEKSYEIVVENTNKITDACDFAKPISKEKCYPKYEDADLKLKMIVAREAAMKKAVDGEVPKNILHRINKELNRIEVFGWAPVFLTGYYLIKNNDLKPERFRMRGYAAGSYVAYLLGLTKSDPLSEELPLYDEMYMGFLGEKEPDMAFAVEKSVRDKVVKSLAKLPYVAKVLVDTNRRIPNTEMIDKWILEYETEFECKLSESEKKMVLHDCEKVVINQAQLNMHYFLIPTGVDVTDYYPLMMDESEEYDFTYYDFHDLSRKFLAVNIIEMSESKLSSKKEKIIKACNPQSYEDYVRALCLARGTGTWEDNAEPRIKEGLELKDVITSWEDVYEKLQDYGFEKAEAFAISELVAKSWMRKKSGVDIEELMRKRGVPEWFIESCKQIVYLSSRATVVENIADYVHYPE